MKKMKTILSIALALVLGVSCTVAAFADETLTDAAAPETTETIVPGALVDFTTQEGYDAWLALRDLWDERKLFADEYTVHGMNQKVQWSFNAEGGYTSFQPIEPLDSKGKNAEGSTTDANGNPANDFRMTAEIEFDTSVYRYVAFLYRLPSKSHIANNNIYCRDDVNTTGEFNGNEGYYCSPKMKATGEWILRVVSLDTELTGAQGTFKSIRIPIAGREGEVFDIQWIAAFKTQEEAENFDIEAYKAALAAEEEAEEEAKKAEEEAANATEEAEETVTEEKSGCGSVVTGSAFAVISVAAGAAWIMAKKKEN